MMIRIEITSEKYPTWIATQIKYKIGNNEVKFDSSANNVKSVLKTIKKIYEKVG